MSRGRLLLVQFSAQRDGSSFSGLLTAEALRSDGWTVEVAFASEGPMEQAYRAAGFSTFRAPHKNWLRTAHPLRALRNAAREVQAGRALARSHAAPELVYLNTGASLAGAVAAGAWQVPCLWHIRELLSDAGGELVVPTGGVAPVRAAFKRLSRGLIANSATVAHNVLGPTLGAEAAVIFNAVGPRFFEDERTPAQARAALGLPPDGRLLGVPGTLRPMKGHPFFLSAARPLLEHHADLRVAITGSGAPGYEAQVREEVRRLGLEARVVFTGSISDMPAFYRACDVACVPSKSEPFGRTVIEAFASGTPVVATSVGGIRETVQPEETGLLVPYGDAPALTAALNRLLTDAVLHAHLARTARADAEARFDESAYKARIVAAVREAARA